MLDHSEYRRWMASAQRTLDSARRDIVHGDYNWACFKAHQAAEKALKALLWGIGRPTPGHSLVHLLQAIMRETGASVPEEVVEAASRLSKHYVPTRYPDAWSEGIPEDYYTRREAEEAVQAASLIIDWVAGAWKRLSRSVGG